jgi:hypothetical protein
MGVLFSGLAHSAEAQKGALTFQISPKDISCGEVRGCAPGDKHPECKGAGNAFIPYAELEISTSALRGLNPFVAIPFFATTSARFDNQTCSDFADLLKAPDLLTGFGVQTSEVRRSKRPSHGDCGLRTVARVELEVKGHKFSGMGGGFDRTVPLADCEK